MIFACLLVGVVLGLISAIVTAAMGYGLLLALTAYMLGGIAGTMLLLVMALVQRPRYAGLVAAEGGTALTFRAFRFSRLREISCAAFATSYRGADHQQVR